MRTRIYTSKKLEKFVEKLITLDTDADTGIFGKWNATLFYVERKKCLLFTNGFTKYNVILPDIKSSDLKNLGEKFRSTFINQLIYDGIIADFKKVDSAIGGLAFLSTDNDRSNIGFQNQRVYELEIWKAEFRSLEHMPTTELASRMNRIHIHLGKSKRFSDFTDSSKEMKRLLSQL